MKIFKSARKKDTSKWWFSFQVETCKFTENKLLKLVNSMKADLLFTSINLHIIIQEKKRHKKAHFMDDALKTRGIIYLNVETSFDCPPLSKFLATRLSVAVAENTQ